jgi:hypothetical protein
MSGGFAGLPTSSISSFIGSCHGSAALTIYSLGRHTINNMSDKSAEVIIDLTVYPFDLQIVLSVPEFTDPVLGRPY